MANKTETGEMQNVANVEGAILSVIDDPPPIVKRRRKRKKKTTKIGQDHGLRAEPVVVPEPPKKRIIRITVQAEFGSFAELAETKDAAIARAEEIAKEGAWQKAGNQMILHTPSSIRRVLVVE